MRDIKFRGKRVDNGDWVYGYYRCIRWEIDKKTHQIINGNSFFEVIPSTVGQFTGLKDKNGVEIYEGDILGNQLGRRWVAWWRSDDRYCGWDLKIVNQNMPHELGQTYSELEVVGNIHDNPNLLESEGS